MFCGSVVVAINDYMVEVYNVVVVFNHRGQSGGPQNISQEIDLRAVDNFCDDLGGHIGAYLVVEHDLCSRPHAESFEQTYLSHWLEQANNDAILALNIKEDGLAQMIKEAMLPFPQLKDRFFCFDCSQSEIQHYQKLGLPLATRVSNYGVELPVGDYIWFDHFPEFYESPYTPLYDWKKYIEDIGYDTDIKWFRIIAVSPELHDGTMCIEDIRTFWSFCNEMGFFGVCTDYPEEAEVYFNGEDKGGSQ